MSAIKVLKKDIRALLNATFPEYKGRKFYIVATNNIGLHNLNWCEGSRTEYRACSIEGLSAGSMAKYNRCAPWKNPAEGAIMPIPQGMIVATHGYFCGHEIGVTFHFNPADMPFNITNLAEEWPKLTAKGSN